MHACASELLYVITHLTLYTQVCVCVCMWVCVFAILSIRSFAHTHTHTSMELVWSFFIFAVQEQQLYRLAISAVCNLPIDPHQLPLF